MFHIFKKLQVKLKLIDNWGAPCAIRSSYDDVLPITSCTRIKYLKLFGW